MKEKLFCLCIIVHYRKYLLVFCTGKASKNIKLPYLSLFHWHCLKTTLFVTISSCLMLSQSLSHCLLQLSYYPIVLLPLSHCHCHGQCFTVLLPLSLSHCHQHRFSLIVTVSVSLHCIRLTISLSLLFCPFWTATASLPYCNFLTITVLLSYGPWLIVKVSISLSLTQIQTHYHCSFRYCFTVPVLLSLSYCLCHSESFGVSLPVWLSHCKCLLAFLPLAHFHSLTVLSSLSYCYCLTVTN